MDSTRLISIHKRLAAFLTDPAELFLVQSVEAQKLFVCVEDGVIAQYDSSTSRFGNGCRENSYKTPLGIHRIKEKIGAGAPLGRIFRHRRDTGIDWDGDSLEENLILTRILRLEGLEEGVNKGSGIDSFERFVYIHGTNREDLVGRPLSHGCLCLRREEMARLFETVDAGTLLYIDPPPLLVSQIPCRSIHFTGIFGTGMSALAQYLRFQGIGVSGSDRLRGSTDTVSLRSALEGLGCAIAPQDGSGVTPDTDAVCVSTAIEESNPDIAAARASGIPIFHRSDLLAALIASSRTIAVAGTSGKSTVTAIIFESLLACGKSPSLISGAPLIRLEREGLVGNAYAGGSDLLVVEADESDGTLTKYIPEASVILNVSKDHKSIEEITGLFETLIRKSRWTASNGDDPILASLPATVRFGRQSNSIWRPDREELHDRSVSLFRNGLEYCLPLPGDHNLENLRAALCVAERFDCAEPPLAEGIKNFQGVARRFTIFETKKGIHVIDDFAHNPAKIAAAVTAARGLAGRIIAVYQPHGFGPTRFLKDEYVKTFRAIFGTGDVLFLLPIYYAGGTAEKNIASEDIIQALGPIAFTAEAVSDRETLLYALDAHARPGDAILLMGARDPSLSTLTKTMVKLFNGETAKT
ncbi:MAG TPA: L,D-transpeptidase family protein [Syntrophorhabdaceae bacterium]|jgi:UDP-N-acetylmuramate--alanine ligase